MIKFPAKKLQQLPTGWIFNPSMNRFEMQCLDGMECRIIPVEGGWVAGRFNTETSNDGQSACFHKTWKEVVAHANS